MLGRGRCGRDVTGRRELEEKPEASRLRRGRGLRLRLLREGVV